MFIHTYGSGGWLGNSIATLFCLCITKLKAFEKGRPSRIHRKRIVTPLLKLLVEKLGIRSEGVAERFLEINGVWEDHVRHAITSEEWGERRDELRALGG